MAADSIPIVPATVTVGRPHWPAEDRQLRISSQQDLTQHASEWWHHILILRQFSFISKDLVSTCVNEQKLPPRVELPPEPDQTYDICQCCSSELTDSQSNQVFLFVIIIYFTSRSSYNDIRDHNDSLSDYAYLWYDINWESERWQIKSELQGQSLRESIKVLVLHRVHPFSHTSLKCYQQLSNLSWNPRERKEGRREVRRGR